MELLYEKESCAIPGACFEAHKEKGNGLLEPLYQECLEIDLEVGQLPFSRQTALRLCYKGRERKHRYTPDLTCYEKIILEIKAAAALMDEHRAQLLNHLKGTGCRLRLLVNSGRHPNLEFERLVL
jgi:GxxExxY protein